MRRISDDDRVLICDRAYEIRKLAVAMIAASGWGHIGGSLSLAEILAVLYEKVARFDSAHPDLDGRDRVVLSKAHAAPAIYAALATSGFFPVERLFTYCRINGLDGHQDKPETPGIECSGGSLGLGLSYSVGLAYGMKLKEHYASRVWCLLGDGETNEGQVWEAAMAAGHYGLDNMIAIMDYNKVMAKGFLASNMGLEPIADKWRSFGWTVLEADGHDVDELYATMMDAKYRAVTGKPICLIAHTVKGHGLEEAEFNYKWHTHAPGRTKAEAFLAELARRYGKKVETLGPGGIKGSPKILGVTESDVSLENLIESTRG